MSWQHWFRRLLGTAPQQAFAALQPISGQLLARQANFLDWRMTNVYNMDTDYKAEKNIFFPL